MQLGTKNIEPITKPSPIPKTVVSTTTNTMKIIAKNLSKTRRILRTKFFSSAIFLLQNYLQHYLFNNFDHPIDQRAIIRAEQMKYTMKGRKINMKEISITVQQGSFLKNEPAVISQNKPPS
ncbi:UNKNOWN [Stylonychia lemnae]|uniref:Uncharacterized protein n=1 Tax=Stylonychia lemnae TaxID=5949 RepID=A0A078AWT0_STYLE|nr:UNKNOWN [Stylonychia lemnae]|eukprot:CDW85268.1 UNKNOWN [Stylonychia lemnae]